MGSLFFSGDSTIVLRGSAEVDAPPEVCAAYDMVKLNSRESKKQSTALARAIKIENEHSFIVYYVRDFRVPAAKPREWVTRVVWRWRDVRTLEVFYNSVDHPGFPVSSKYTRAHNTVLNVYQRLPEGAQGTTKVTWTQQVNLKLKIPKWLARRLGVSQIKYDLTKNLLRAIAAPLP
jgi:hypothetical protein